LTPAAIDTLMPSTSGIFAGRQFEQPGARRGRTDRADGAGGVPGAATIVVGIGAAQPRGDLEADDERRQRLGRRRAGALGERQQRRNDRRHQLALHVGEVEVECVRGDAVRQRRQLRRGTQRLAHDRDRGLGVFRAHQFEHDRRGLAAASRQHHADGVGERGAGALDRKRGSVLEFEPGDEGGDARRDLCAGGIGCFRCLRRLRARRARCAEQRHGARPEEQSAIHVVALHLVAPPGFFRLFGHRANSKDV
jgi:hypothetical protein